MLFAQAPQRTRRAFTLIELLTVVIIIGILAGLVTAAAIRVRISVRKASHALELKQLEMALHAYKEKFGEFPPDGLPSATHTAEQLFKRHLRKAFPRCTTVDAAWDAYKDKLNPSTALTFWLGGRREGGAFTGFSADPTNPFGTTTTSRIGPFYTEFDLERLSSADGRYYPTVAAIQSGNTNRAIRYYRAENGGYAGKGYIPFKDSRTAELPADMGWINPRSFQIISPGLGSGQFNDSRPDSPESFACFPDGPYPSDDPNCLEMMSSFTGGTMEDALP